MSSNEHKENKSTREITWTQGLNMILQVHFPLKPNISNNSTTTIQCHDNVVQQHITHHICIIYDQITKNPNQKPYNNLTWADLMGSWEPAILL